MNRILAAFRNSWNGLVHASRNEAAFRQEIGALIIAVPLAMWLADRPLVFALLVAPLLLLLVVELLNTGIEAICDGLSRDYMDEIKIAKDCGSAAVGLTMCLTGIIWLAIIVQKFGFGT